MINLQTQAQLNKQCIEQHEGRINAVEKHIETTNHEMGEIRDTIKEVKTDVAWLKKSVWFVITTSISTLLTVVLQFIFNR